VGYAREGVTEWWENRTEGLEQGFPVEAPPDGEGALVLELALEGLDGTGEEDGEGLELEGGTLRYGGLQAWDATGQPLAAWMELDRERVRLRGCDAGAAWPVTIDPLLTSAAWTGKGEATDNYYGVSVTSAGDVNGDGYADVIVGASGFSSYTGKAYLYLGSSSGLARSAPGVPQRPFLPPHALPPRGCGPPSDRAQDLERPPRPHAARRAGAGTSPRSVAGGTREGYTDARSIARENTMEKKTLEQLEAALNAVGQDLAQRVEVLAQKSTAGLLTSDEHQEYSEIVRLNDTISILKLQAEEFWAARAA
jgi:hypothetical protein